MLVCNSCSANTNGQHDFLSSLPIRYFWNEAQFSRHHTFKRNANNNNAWPVLVQKYSSLCTIHNFAGTYPGAMSGVVLQLRQSHHLRHLQHAHQSDVWPLPQEPPTDRQTEAQCQQCQPDCHRRHRWQIPLQEPGPLGEPRRRTQPQQRGSVQRSSKTAQFVDQHKRPRHGRHLTARRHNTPLACTAFSQSAISKFNCAVVEWQLALLLLCNSAVCFYCFEGEKCKDQYQNGHCIKWWLHTSRLLVCVIPSKNLGIIFLLTKYIDQKFRNIKPPASLGILHVYAVIVRWNGKYTLTDCETCASRVLPLFYVIPTVTLLNNTLLWAEYWMKEHMVQ